MEHRGYFCKKIEKNKIDYRDLKDVGGAQKRNKNNLTEIRVVSCYWKKNSILVFTIHMLRTGGKNLQWWAPKSRSVIISKKGGDGRINISFEIRSSKNLR